MSNLYKVISWVNNLLWPFLTSTLLFLVRSNASCWFAKIFGGIREYRVKKESHQSNHNEMVKIEVQELKQNY